MSSECQGKSSWPELVGTNGSAAAAVIENENDEVQAAIVEEGNKLVSSDFRCDRVRLWVDVKGFVTRVPVIG
ncbi:LOW QUALITY PROTEIN: glu S.griseus protease inhibitor-like [Diospyros lotus]|uniref:LOW QUALITY PROTEIN: glu S.griseus protease inhibitor-like n=1 Tax=Diospyros lotus TaxID=55363 RepID=UPI00224FC526|nr:LOW QUALITY PROTEIN: glu S.griseus protease inhibitor-like [Diospyros lotus]